jgi:outer membrane protein OmpA-like peptidoglycan-associated protein/tetratricopeptide (TPR) repeat protein
MNSAIIKENLKSRIINQYPLFKIFDIQRINKLLFLRLLLFALLFSTAFKTQSQSDCTDDLSKKTIKLIEEGQNRKYLIREQIDFFKEALEIDESCLECKFQLGLLYFEKAKRGSGSYTNSTNYFRELVAQCPTYHSDAWYYLGLIAYGQQDYQEAALAFNEYIHFPPDDASKFSKDADIKYDDVKEVIAEIEFFAEFYGNPVPFEPEVVKYVSTKGDEYLPMISPDNEIIFYTAKFNKKAKGDLFAKEIELFMWSKRPEIDAEFEVGEAMSQPFNLGDNYGGVSISVNNKELYVTVCKPRSDGYNDCDIYVSRFEKTFDERFDSWDWGWSELENLGPNINTNDGWEAQPSITADGNTLYYATAREASINHSIDIYTSKRQADGTWGKAQPIKANINTSGNEKSPFIHSDSKTLYFSSDGRKGAGGYDIYYTHQDTAGNWSEPKNIGYPINSEKDEHGLIVSTDGKTAYYSTNRLQGIGGYDIYRFAMPVDAKPENVILIKGQIKDADDFDIEATKITIKNLQTKAITDVEIDMDDGKYAIVLNTQQNDYLLQIEKEDVAFEAHVFMSSNSEKIGVVSIDFDPETIEVGTDYVINDIKYATNSADINESSKWVLDAFADYLIRYPNLKVMILGHTDNVGDKLANYALSAARAFTVKEYLQSKGVSAARVDFKGYGETKPIATNKTPEGRALNRRTEFRILEK